MFSRYEPDLLGLQELALEVEVDQILALRPGYEALYYQATDSIFTYPDATIVYRTDRFERVDNGFYWLSPTPDEASSTGFADPQLPRLLAWAHLRDRRSRRELYFGSTHFDNNAPSQELSAPLVLERTEPWAARMPVVVVGDFNARPDAEAYRILVEGTGGVRFVDAMGIAAEVDVESNARSEPDYDFEARIDHVFLAGNTEGWVCPRWAVDLHLYGPNDTYPSDHRAIFADLVERSGAP